MTIKVDCPHCSRHYSLSDDLTGKTIRCKQCRSPFLVEPLAEKSPDPDEHFSFSGDSPLDRLPPTPPRPRKRRRRRSDRRKKKNAPESKSSGSYSKAGASAFGSGILVFLLLVLRVYLRYERHAARQERAAQQHQTTIDDSFQNLNTQLPDIDPERQESELRLKQMLQPYPSRSRQESISRNFDNFPDPATQTSQNNTPAARVCMVSGNVASFEVKSTKPIKSIRLGNITSGQGIHATIGRTHTRIDKINNWTLKGSASGSARLEFEVIHTDESISRIVVD